MRRQSLKRLSSTPGSKTKKLRKLLKLPFHHKRLDISRIRSATPQLTSIKATQSVKKATPGTNQKKKKKKKQRSGLNTPKTCKLSTQSRPGPNAVSPLVVLSRHPSRGFLDSPITIDDSLHDERILIDLSDLPDHDPIPPVVKTSKKRPAESALTPKSQRHEPAAPPPAKKLAFDKSMEEGELPLSPITNGNRGNRGPGGPPKPSDIEIITEVKAQPKRPPENWRSKSSRRYFNPRFPDRMKVWHRRAPRGPSATTSRDRRQPHQANRPPPPLPAHPPRLVLNPANFNFTEALNIVPGQVFEFKGSSRPLVPRMGARQISSSASCSSMGMGNVFVSPIENDFVAPKTGLRPIVIDGSNVAVAHGQFLRPSRNQTLFSSRGIQICVDYFKRRGHHDITAIIPHFRLKSGMSEDRHLLEALERQGHLMTTPSRDLSHGEHIASYDDRFIVQRAALTGGVIVSNDNYRDLMGEDRSMRDTIDQRLLMFRFLDQTTLMFPTDPLGSKGPNLDKFLNF
ncbi:hypothetical protein TCAL_00335 [Tigriopus californicus]|uniref:RNase NYN domain-containing protein n=1 Tax=Tigriopus californicus TaxID=6832 RepID=A0A553NF29_TIGCA|nr:uncharacterized protein LOC131887688 [Tigriopus californicus]TRY64054.1 hypothetical protein TCAL_00335 [Tigriopus californicus]|eukprot:TCALIF_00335-PA protein Name:"Similar to ZC3H12D Probable ribonuclease ZC3H12D (Homo sapiens)" AED:0.00 eAED:0.00 QI:152/1/1/1/1/1/3/435/512